MWSLKTSGMEALAGYWAPENPVADRLKPRFRVHLEALAGYRALENPVADRLKPRFRVHLDLLYSRTGACQMPETAVKSVQ
jgi:hypothetical protein